MAGRLFRWALLKATGRVGCRPRDILSTGGRLNVGSLVTIENSAIMPAIQTAATALSIRHTVLEMVLLTLGIPDFRERSPPRLPFLSYGYRDRAPSTDHTARQTPSSVSATERIADLRAQRVAERDSPSAPVGQSPTPPTQAQGAQGQVHQNLERRLREQEQRHQAAVTQLQQEATAADTSQEAESL
ncbi:hypothetical protein J4E91_011083 [Alternaria rosae]|nr:hypothetical protein J4E91_011083 [Alternaria rosae]